MILRIDKLQIELPMPEEPDPDSAAVVQELLGGRFGEMSTLMNYTFQSFNFRGKKELKPFYDLIANIGAEEYGHVELVAATVNALLNGASRKEDPSQTPLASGLKGRNPHHFIVTGQGALVANSMNAPWQGDYVFNSGDLVLDLLHNFFLECGARLHKIRVYEMTSNPVAREMIGYLLVRGGVHATAYARALELLTGVDVTRMLPIPKIENRRFPEARKYEEAGQHRKLYRFSLEDYRDIAKIWKGVHPQDGQPLEVVDGPPPGGPQLDLDEAPEASIPGFAPEELHEVAQRLLKEL
ncbi:manganese catalase family protein [Rhodothermus profundi]|uniref:Mn-containing catalase (Includes spore coat protein CotJC) n=1 Tax=Rhodothermus profundi TaxID=633813 RepID=A0A1M6R8W4_9BACT|nr:manganese catalase family protein [Rhodothermus profundi]SHK28914.1 Mn-containing catalase (includes spore coat protein CotJC) [Rhodothermus profundi]